ncbi:MAG: hypothetical protein Kow0099_36550 [Candidatus Abyssubacteria bacterium]
MPSENAPLSRSRILIVEDDPVNVELLTAQLHDEGYMIEAALDGEEALERVAHSKPDLILLDIMIPKRSGFEVCKVIKGTPETRAIPVIMVTALQDMESRVKGIAVGADDFLSRPVDKSELITRVKSMLRTKHLYDELARESQTARKSTEKIELQQRVLKSMSTQLMQASHMKYEFIANMSHALRTPLNVIIGFSEMLQDELVGKLNEKQAKYVGNILASGAELQRLIANIMDVFKIDTGKMPLEMTDFSLKEALCSATSLFEEETRRKRIRISVEVKPEVSRIYADPQKLATIMHNLLSNAVRFTPAGGQIEVTAQKRDRDVEICVADSGIGFPPEDAARIFTEFYKVSDPAAPPYGGSGLGLAIAKKLVLMHGGEIWAESEKGKGARVYFTLPLERRKDHVQMPSESGTL